MARGSNELDIQNIFKKNLYLFFSPVHFTGKRWIYNLLRILFPTRWDGFQSNPMKTVWDIYKTGILQNAKNIFQNNFLKLFSLTFLIIA